MVNPLPGWAGSGRMRQHLKLNVSGAFWVSNPSVVGGETETEKMFDNVVFLRSSAQQDTCCRREEPC